MDVRVLAATNRDLTSALQEGAFRHDLYYRLNVIPIRLPTLRERRDDIPLLVGRFIEQYRSITGKGIEAVSPEAMALLMEHSYPGNVRELENVIEHAFVKCSGAVIEPAHLPDAISSPEGDMVSRALRTADPLPALERELARRVLDECGGDRQRACERLGISRTTLWRRLRGE